MSGDRLAHVKWSKEKMRCECGANRIVEFPGYNSGAYPCQCPGGMPKWIFPQRESARLDSGADEGDA